jgi:membrane protein YdbS with pleckstrin-like domain
MGAATVLHWENFNHAHHTTVLWVVLYAVTPVLVPAVWVHNRRTASGDPSPGRVELPLAVRAVGGVLAVFVTGTAVALFVAPELMISVWPWTVSPLTARILSGWFVLFGVVNGAAALDPRWSAARILVQSELLGFTLVLADVVRVWGNFDQSNVLTWAVVGGMVLYVAAVLLLYVWMERRRGGRRREVAEVVGQ